jgi:hypothetical protein
MEQVRKRECGKEDNGEDKSDNEDKFSDKEDDEIGPEDKDEDDLEDPTMICSRYCR